MQNLRENCFDVAVYCFRFTSYQGCPNINIEFMMLHRATKNGSDKGLRVNHKIEISRVYYLWFQNLLSNFELRTQFAYFREKKKVYEELFGT
jgi:hypothetical protein